MTCSCCRSGCWCLGDQLADPQAVTPRQHLHYSLAAEAWLLRSRQGELQSVKVYQDQTGNSHSVMVKECLTVQLQQIKCCTLRVFCSAGKSKRHTTPALQGRHARVGSMPAETEAIDNEAAAAEIANAALGIDIGQLQVSALILRIANCSAWS